MRLYQLIYYSPRCGSTMKLIAQKKVFKKVLFQLIYRDEPVVRNSGSGSGPARTRKNRVRLIPTNIFDEKLIKLFQVFLTLKTTYNTLQRPKHAGLS